MSSRGLILGLLGIAGSVWLALGWTFSPRHYFVFDSWSHFYWWGVVLSPQQMWNALTILPDQLLNDRPLGFLFSGGLYRLVGLNSAAFYSVWLVLHLLNATLVFLLGARVLRSEPLGFAAALIFATSIPAMRVATWVGAVFDLTCTTFVLLSLATYLQKGFSSRVVSLACFLLAMRCKEMALALPALVLLIELAQNGWPWGQAGWNREDWSGIAKRSGPHIILGCIFLAAYASLYANSDVMMSPDHPYYKSISAEVLVEALRFYTHAMVPLFMHPRDLLPTWTLTLLGGTVVLASWRGRRAVVFGALGFVIVLLPVAFLTNHRDELYLYLPSTFFAIGSVALVHWLVESAMNWRRPTSFSPHRKASLGLSLGLIVFLTACIVRSDRARTSRNWWLEHGAASREVIQFLSEELPTVKGGTTFVVNGAPEYLSLFGYNGGMPIQVFYRDKTVKVVLGAPNSTLEVTRDLYDRTPIPKILLDYADSRTVVLIASDGQLPTGGPLRPPSRPPPSARRR